MIESSAWISVVFFVTINYFLCCIILFVSVRLYGYKDFVFCI